MTVDAGVRDWMAEKGYDPQMGPADGAGDPGNIRSPGRGTAVRGCQHGG